MIILFDKYTYLSRFMYKITIKYFNKNVCSLVLQNISEESYYEASSTLYAI